MAERFRRQQPEGETRFGHVVLHPVGDGDVYDLDLYQIPSDNAEEALDFALRGYYLPLRKRGSVEEGAADRQRPSR
jgi:hypothetical protein